MWGSGKFVDRLMPDVANAKWSSGCLPDLSGMYQYVVLIRWEHDPERSPREYQKRHGMEGTEYARKLRRSPPESFRKLILDLLSDDRPRTFNEITVTIIDVTADFALGGGPEKILWKLVEEGAVEHTMDAPIFFRKRDPNPKKARRKRAFRPRSGT